VTALGGRAHRVAGLALVFGTTLLLLAGLYAPSALARDLEVPIFSTPGLNPDNSPSTVPGARPYELVNSFTLNQSPTAEELSGGGNIGPAANLKDLRFELPPGVLATAVTFPRCGQEAFTAGACSTATQVGVANLTLAAGLGTLTVPVFNLLPPGGSAAQFAFRANGSAVHVNFQLRGGSDYGVTETVNGLSEAAGLLSSSVRIWGVPGDPGHDALRFTGNGTPAPGPYPEAPPFRPLLSNPTSCTGPLVTTMEATTWQNPGLLVSAAPFEAPAVADCNELDFSPTIEAKPTTNLGDSPSGLEVHLHIPQNQDPEGSASGQLRSARIVLPAGLGLNPAAAAGIGSCSPEQIGLAGLTNARQLLRYDLPPVNFSGTFRVTFAGQTTVPIPATAGRAQVTAALETLPGLSGNVTVSGAPGGWIVTFTGALAATGVPPLSGTVTDNPSQILAVTGEAGSFELEYGGVATDPLPFDADAAEIQSALRSIPALGLGNLFPGNVFVQAAGTEEAATLFQLIFAGDLAGTKPVITAVSSLTGPEAGVTVTPQEPPPPRSLSVASFGGNAPGTQEFNSAPAACPEAAKIGIVRIDSPAVLDHPLTGNVYLATPVRNPFGSLLTIYLVVEDPATGIVLKLPAKVETDPQTGQLSATFAETPQLPFEDLRLELFKGTAAPLRTPIACGAYTVETLMTPWSAPEGAVRRPKDTFAIAQGAGAGACPTSAATAPDSTKFEAGTVEPSAGIYSPFTLKLSRPDGARELGGIDTTLPPGLLAKLAGVGQCSDAALGSAAAHSGAQEQASPSCPAGSRVGSVAIAAGSGPTPFNLSGSVYLAGPYKGAPLSLAVVTPVVAGPFDLGTVVLRVALSVDPRTARVHAVSDALPTSLQGVGIDLRSVALSLDPTFTKNPTSCNPLAFSGAGPAQSVHFQVGDCGKLTFKPKLAVALSGGTKAHNHPALKATLSFPAKGNSANLATASLTLPKSLGLDKARLKSGGVIGSAKATTPLLASPLQGPVYLRSRGAKQPPELVAELAGAVNVVLTGRLQVTKAGAVRAEIEEVPDAPISSFILNITGGKKGLFENATNLCASSPRAAALFDGQNAVTREESPLIAAGCKKAGKGKGKKRTGHGGGK
jgi:hypothetical protein